MVKENGVIEQWEDSQGIRLSKKEVGFKGNKQIQIIADKTVICLRKTDMHFTSLQEMFDAYDYHNFYKCKEIDSGPPVGEEVW